MVQVLGTGRACGGRRRFPTKLSTVRTEPGRDGNRRYYDLIERLLPPDIVARKVPLREQVRHKLLSRYRAHGLLGTSGGGDSFGGLGPAKPDPERPEHPGRTAPRRGFVDAMRAALRAYLHLASASRLEWAPHLSMERQLFLTRP